MNVRTIAANTSALSLLRRISYHELIGYYALESIGEEISRFYFLKEDISSCHNTTSTPLLDEAEKQVQAYLNGELMLFDLPFILHGTNFQQTVWQALNSIPYGTTCSYKDIAEIIQNPKAVRAVGGANNKNPLPLFFPCHRVIGSNNKLVGYAGGLDIKRRLLLLEGIQL